MTGYFAGGSREGLERARQTQCCSRIIHLAKLNPQVSYELFGLFVTEFFFMFEMFATRVTNLPPPDSQWPIAFSFLPHIYIHIILPNQAITSQSQESNDHLKLAIPLKLLATGSCLVLEAAG